MNLPPPSVKLENEKWVFYRGDVKVDRKNSLPHPLKGIIKKLKVSFD
jgi:hypothetical protein